jgi:uncharacterized protein
MIAVDTNILVYAHREDSSFHAAALRVLTQLVENEPRWAIPWPCVHEFISVVTHPRIYLPPTPIQTAIASIRQWIEQPNCTLLCEGPSYFSRLSALCENALVQGGMAHDARIAALALDNGVQVLYSADRDFSRFEPLHVRNPLIGEPK